MAKINPSRFKNIVIELSIRKNLVANIRLSLGHTIM